MAAPITLRIVDPQPEPFGLGPASYDIGGSGPKITFGDNFIKTENEDGSATFDFGGGAKETGDESDFYRNLTDEITESELSHIASELLTGIDLDIQSRKDWMDNRATGIRLLAFKLEEPRGDIGTSSAPLEGMSSIRHPLLTEAVIKFQATARGELLPAGGPVKVRNDLPMRPDAPDNPYANPMIGSNGGPPLEGEGEQLDELGAALEKDFNHYLTVTATEYVPDTDRMLFMIGFGGDGFKKVYNCPLRRRPVSESVDAEDLIVSNYATDLRNAGRVTHRSKMRPSILRRLQISGHYRDFRLAPPNPAQQVTAPQQEKAEVGGYKPQPQQPRDADYEILECYCELDLDAFAPKSFRGKGVPLPYVVTLERESRQVLAVRRNWDEDDEQALAKQFFVQFPFIRGLGFYGLGLVHLLGNVTIALTAIWRIMIDNGMFSNFPGFLIAKGATRQNINQMRVAPGSGFPVDVPVSGKISDYIMPLPYKETGAALTNLAVHIEEVGQRLGQTAEINIGEGKQDVPVGTTMALIEQATKIMDSVHKRLHAAQAEEFQLLKERFREDPEAFWRHNRKPARQWTIEQFKQALEERELVPVADPNNPTSLHRIAKATIIDMLVSKYPLDIDRRHALKRILRIAGIDADGLINAQPNQPPPDPRMVAIQAKAQAEQMANQIDQAKLFIEKQKAQAEFADSQAERAFKERMQQFEMQLEQLRVQAEMIIHAHDIHRDNAQANNDMAMKQAELQHNVVSDHISNQTELAQNAQRHQQDMQVEAQRGAMDLHLNHAKNQQQLAMQREQHAQQINLEREKHAASLENQKKIAEAKAEAIGPTEKEKSGREGEQHELKMKMDKESHERAGEKHKVDLANSKKLADAKAKALARPKPKPSGDK